jgi:hypothetical protein
VSQPNNCTIVFAVDVSKNNFHSRLSVAYLNSLSCPISRKREENHKPGRKAVLACHTRCLEYV